MTKAKFKQGYYIPKNPDKYVGDVTKIRYMSSYELSVHKFFDNSTRVIRWSSEEIVIPYVKPTDGRVHKYYPDYWVEYVTSDGEIKQEIIEVKPSTQTRMPRANSKGRLYEQLNFAINTAKWEASKRWCQQHNMEFRILTEQGIFK